MSTSGWSGRASQASLEPKPARRAVTQTTPGRPLQGGFRVQVAASRFVRVG